jgi:hypothetical protein
VECTSCQACAGGLLDRYHNIKRKREKKEKKKKKENNHFIGGFKIDR